MDEREPHRPNYAALSKEQEKALQRQQEQEGAQEPGRPDRIRSAGWTNRGDIASQQRSAIERHNELNPPNWKLWLKDRDQLAEAQREFQEEQKRMLQPDGHLPPGSGGHTP